MLGEWLWELSIDMFPKMAVCGSMGSVRTV
jgi:hypothetical protein